MSRDYYLSLAKGFGLRPNHHNVQDLIDKCETYGRVYEARQLRKIIAGKSGVTSSIFIEPFLDIATELELAMPQAPESDEYAVLPKTHDIRTPEGARALADHIKAQTGKDVIPVFARRVEHEARSVYGAEHVPSEPLRAAQYLPPEDPRDVEVEDDPIPQYGGSKHDAELYVGPVRLNFRQLQEEHYAWVSHNFPEQLNDPTRKDDGFDGLVEEVGELARARLKRRQGIRGTKEEWDAQEQDALADAIVFITSYCNAHGIDLQTVVEKTWNEVKKRDWIKHPKTGVPPAAHEEFAEFKG